MNFWPLNDAITKFKFDPKYGLFVLNKNSIIRDKILDEQTFFIN